jgi:hypothetical protein
MVGGWHDIFLPWQLRDYAALRAAGSRPYLTVGPWTHGSFGLFGAALREGVAWLHAHLRDEPAGVRERAVRLCVDGGGGWRDYDDWPPDVTRTGSWFLQTDAGLGPTAPNAAGTGASTLDRFRYDPADPTPSIGGPLLVSNVAGPRDNRALEARSDVLVYTSAPLDSDVEVIGPVTATIYSRASRPYFDVFVRLCDVEPSGRSLNVCDGLVRVVPGRHPVDAEGVQTIPVELWPTAYRFRSGHRIRLQVSGGAHPRYARNPGTGEPLATAVHLRPVEIEIFHEPDRPSSVHLPVVP